MSVITFVNNTDKQVGKTMSLVAIATLMAIDYNNKILVVSTTNKKDKIKQCFFEEEEVKKIRQGLLGNRNVVTLDTESGIEGIVKMLRSNKLTSDMITNYTKVVFKDRLEILLGVENKLSNEEEKAKESEIEQEYLNLINIADKYYDKIFIDLDNNVSEDIRKKIINRSDLTIVTASQNFTEIKEIKERKEKNDRLLNSPKTLLLIGKYDKYSKYNTKNITRYLEEKRQVLSVPYNTLYFEATNEASVPDLFLKLKKISDIEDRNIIFIKEVKRAAESIIYRIQELQAKF